MMPPKPYERLLARLSELHAAAVREGESPVTESRTAARERLQCAIDRAKSDTRHSSIASKRTWLGRRSTWTVAIPVAVIAAAGLALAPWPRSRVEIRPEPLVPSIAAPVISAMPTPAKPRDPCEHAVHAQGNRPVIDDFEDANPLIASAEGRVALWSLYKDTESPGANSTLVPTLRPQASRTNRYALHAKGGELRNWGAVIQIAFTPSCYDASAYGGISFSAKGPGRLYAGAREVRTVPAEYGGTCTSDCYNTHQKKIELTSQWRTYTIKWSEMYQRGYDMAPLDASRINSIAFLIMPGDTPFDLWIDDVKFVESDVK